MATSIHISDQTSKSEKDSRSRAAVRDVPGKGRKSVALVRRTERGKRRGSMLCRREGGPNFDVENTIWRDQRKSLAVRGRSTGLGLKGRPQVA